MTKYLFTTTYYGCILEIAISFNCSACAPVATAGRKPSLMKWQYPRSRYWLYFESWTKVVPHDCSLTPCNLCYAT